MKISENTDRYFLLSIIFLILTLYGAAMAQENNQNYRKLNAAEKQVILQKGTEAPHTGKYDKHNEKGVYCCKQCGLPLYTSNDKFTADCGWPAFDDEIGGAVNRIPDADGHRTEIVCSRCGAHLGHVFSGENYTEKNIRHCVNSISLIFNPASDQKSKAIFAGGCFWGMEYHFQKTAGVLAVKAGYIGGTTDNPTYEEICNKSTGHAEAIEITFDPGQITYTDLLKLFFEIHDPGQVNRQGPDIGDQYRSAIFYFDEMQKRTAEKLIALLKDKGYKVVTELQPAEKFWEAEQYHQNYYEIKGEQPYCHIYQKKF